jgi:hypothetical protein
MMDTDFYRTTLHSQLVLKRFYDPQYGNCFGPIPTFDVLIGFGDVVLERGLPLVC